MPDPPKRIIIEKSRTVRRRYQRSNQRFQFTPSQIARIEREEERERRAQSLREKEKRRIANKKKKAEKEAKAREERRRLGLPDPNAPTVPSSQPLLFNFLRKDPQPGAQPDPSCDETETHSSAAGSVSGGDDDCEVSGLDDYASDDTIVADDGTKTAGVSTVYSRMSQDEGPEKDKENEREDDEFSDCSIFYDEDIIKEAEQIATTLDTGKREPEAKPQTQGTKRALLRAESFRDETADLLEEFAADEGFWRDLARRNAG
ncbi:hypothetical protein BDV59DRAFT_76996 [Aspergillus ambiguus]|uniref:uncharacterized protein n=1 Tax=Aspergillus ambiguus TaxID=176160 RepID=UPI003CCE3725